MTILAVALSVVAALMMAVSASAWLLEAVRFHTNGRGRRTP